MKARIVVIKKKQTRDEYRALIQIRNNFQPLIHKEIVYQHIEETKEQEIMNRAEIREIITRLKKFAKEWACEQKIPFIANLSPPSYYS